MFIDEIILIVDYIIILQDFLIRLTGTEDHTQVEITIIDQLAT